MTQQVPFTMYYPPRSDPIWQNPEFQKIAETWGVTPAIYEVHFTLLDVDAAALLASGFTDIFDGTGTPAVVDFVSASVEDDPDKGGAVPGTGIHTIRIFGIDTNGNYATEDLNLNGAAAVTTTTLWQRLIGFWGITFGSGKKAAGAITCHENGGAVSTYMTIAANGLRSLSSRFYVPTGWRARIMEVNADSQQAVAAAAYDLDRGTLFYPELVDAVDWDTYALDAVHYGYTCTPTAPVKEMRVPGWEVAGGTTAYIAFNHVTIDTGNNHTVAYKIRYAVWRDRFNSKWA